MPGNENCREYFIAIIPDIFLIRNIEYCKKSIMQYLVFEKCVSIDLL